MLKSGTIIQDRYTIVRPLGSGGFGAVFLATDGRLGQRNVAIKYFATAHMRPDELDSLAHLFQQEAHTLASLSHPNLAPVLDYFAVDDGWMLVMGYVPGESLSALQKRLNGPFGEQQVIDWAIELCHVLEYLHNQRPPLIFRDLKPANIMRTPEGKVILIDFGIVRRFKEGQHQDTIQIGTPGYAPPEQYGGQTEPRSDLYSLGSTMYVLLTNERVTTGLRLPPVSQSVEWVSPALDDLITQLTSLHIDQRPASAAAVRAELERIRDTPMVPIADPFAIVPQAAPYRNAEAPTRVNPQLQQQQQSYGHASVTPQPIQATPQPVIHQRKAQIWPWLVLVVLLFGGGGAGWWYLNRSNTPDQPLVVPTQSSALPDSAKGNLIISSRDGNSGAYTLLSLDIPTGAVSEVVPHHDDNAIASRRRSDGRVAYSHGVDGLEQIFTISANGSDEQQLTSAPGESRAPRWSPDGSKIAFESDRDRNNNNSFDIYIMDADGSNVQRVTAEGGWQGGPAWSPDGTKLAFHSQTSGLYEIVVLDLTTSKQYLLASVDDSAFWADWSPDGQTIAFMTGDNDSRTKIYTVPTSGGEPRELTNLGTGKNRWPRWSPDGRYLAFESYRNDHWGIYLQHLATGKVEALSDGTRHDRWPSW